MKIAAGLMALGWLAAAQEPLMTTGGESLEEFSVAVRADTIRRDTPAALARSYARFVQERQSASRAFVRLFRRKHLEIMARYYSRGLVEKQRAYYASRSGGAMSCRVADVRETVATLRLEWADRADRSRIRSIRLELGRDQGGWRIRRVLEKSLAAGWVDRGTNIPPRLPDFSVPAAKRMDRGTPPALVASLLDEMLRLRGLGQRGTQGLYRGALQLSAGFCGRHAVEREQERQAAANPGRARRFEIEKPRVPEAGVVRLLVVASEAVPGTKGKRSAIGQEGFELKKQGRAWRITAEFTRPHPQVPLAKLPYGFGLFFTG